MQKKILITGASGFIGSFLVEEALNRNYETIAGIRSSSSKKFLSNPTLQFLDLDYTNEITLDQTLKQFTNKFGKFDYRYQIIHM